MSNVRRIAASSHSIEAEQALLGSLLISDTAWSRIASLVEASDLYRPDHRLIFGAIAALEKSGQAHDTVTVADLLERQGSLDAAGGLAYIGRLAKDTPTAANVETYAAAVRERSGRRRLREIADAIAKSTGEGDSGVLPVAELVAAAQEQLQRLQSQTRTGNGLTEVRVLIGELTDDLDARAAGPTGLRVGLPDFDELTCGLEGGDLVVIAARPGMGKTALLGSMASTASNSTGVAIFSAEMPAQQLMRRFVSMHGAVPQGLLRRAERLQDEHWAKIYDATGIIAKQQMWIDDTGSPSLTHVRSECISLKARTEIGLVLVDYVQLVRGVGANRYEQLREVAYGLKALAKELSVPVVALAQLNRGVESRDGKRPAISDLRDSGAIEEAADVIGLLYSESYYHPEFPMPYVLECNVAKNRNGERGECLWRFEGEYSRITALEAASASHYRLLRAKKADRSADNL